VATGRHARGVDLPSAPAAARHHEPSPPHAEGSAAGTHQALAAQRTSGGHRASGAHRAPSILEPVLGDLLLAEAAPDAPVPSGRRRKPAGTSELSATESTGPLPAVGTPADPTGRRRKPGPVVETPAAALDRPAGRRRKAPETPQDSARPAPRLGEAPLAELPELQGVQARPEPHRTVAAARATRAAAADPVAPPATVVPRGAVDDPRSVVVGDVVRAAVASEQGGRASHRKAPPRRVAAGSRAASVSALGADRPQAGHRRKPKKSILPGVPGSPALVAGAAAVTVAAVAVVNVADQGPAVSAEAQNVAQASAVEVAPASAAQVRREVLTADELARERAVRASRQRARAALAQRKLVAAQQAKKEDLARTALEVAHARVVRLAQLADLFSLPVKGYHLTAGFGDGGLWSRRHTGLDFACSWGTPIRAVAAGEIVSAKWDGAYGWKTIIRLPDGTENWYAHQSAFVVRSGHVEAGQIIGRVGSTGHTTGPHLHFEVRINDVPVNPKPWLQARGLRP
jgi:murein DD-endopeptidase MepM/ murein hydrolase activator NlpD